MDEAVVYSADEAASVTFRFSDAEHGYTVGLAARQARLEMGTDLRWKPLSTFFGSIATDWRGWEGERELTAMKELSDYGPPAFRLTASNDGGGHTTVVAELGSPYLGTNLSKEGHDTHVGFAVPTQSGAWSLRVVLLLESWQLDGIAADISALTPTADRGLW